MLQKIVKIVKKTKKQTHVFQLQNTHAVTDTSSLHPRLQSTDCVSQESLNCLTGRCTNPEENCLLQSSIAQVEITHISE